MTRYKVDMRRDGLEPWTRQDEFWQRLRNAKNMAYFAWLALRYDSALFACVLFNSCRYERDAVIGSIMIGAKEIKVEELSGGSD